MTTSTFKRRYRPCWNVVVIISSNFQLVLCRSFIEYFLF